MAVKIGIIGIGFMGSTHFRKYQSIKNAKVVALCDIDKQKLSGDFSKIAGNIGGGGSKVDLSGYELYDDADRMIAEADLDVVDITLPTYLHDVYAVKALKAGRHVFCEKPIALDSSRAKKMVDAAAKADRRLFIGHCIRFWPAYAEARKLVQGGKFGKVMSATFRRLSSTPVWSWQNWLQAPEKSGLVALDLHIHDTDFVLYTFGKPKAVMSAGSGFSKGRIDHITTTFQYGDDSLISAEGAWEFAPAFPFEMTFNIAMEKATIMCGTDGVLRVFPVKGATKEIKVNPEDGWGMELRHFVDCIHRKVDSDVVSPQTALDSVKLIELEMKSARTGKPVKVNF